MSISDLLVFSGTTFLSVSLRDVPLSIVETTGMISGPVMPNACTSAAAVSVPACATNIATAAGSACPVPPEVRRDWQPNRVKGYRRMETGLQIKESPPTTKSSMVKGGKTPIVVAGSTRRAAAKKIAAQAAGQMSSDGAQTNTLPVISETASSHFGRSIIDEVGLHGDLPFVPKQCVEYLRINGKAP